ncbi:MAG: fumarylacetoacetate hydrolase family protein [Steroidobacteraceae bacterium]
MKLATLRNGTRDGQLVIVTTDLSKAVAADGIAANLITALESWSQVEPRLQQLSRDLHAGRVAAEPFDAQQAMAPLPRAPQWLDASAFHSHGDLLEKVLGMDPPKHKREIPLMYQGASDDFLGAHEDVPLPSEADGMDFEAEVGVILDDVPMGVTAADAAQHVKLLTLINDVSLRVLAGFDIKTGFGFLQAKPSSSFGPVAVTPDELGDAWRDGRVQLPIYIHWNDKEFGHPHAGQMGFSFAQLIAHAARTRRLHAGTVLGSGTVSNDNYREVGSACIAERRGIEKEDSGAPITPYMKFGDVVRIDMFDASGKTLFGKIEQRMVQKTYP